MGPAARKAGPGRKSGPEQVDRHIAGRLRERRVLLGLTQQDLAELVGVTYQQMHKYETGQNRMSAGRLAEVARALGVDGTFFYEGLGVAASVSRAPAQRQILELARSFLDIRDPPLREALCEVARVLAGTDEVQRPGGDDGRPAAPTAA